MSHSNCNRPLTQELSKAYLSGKLSPSEMYAVEDRLLESDFHFEALEGLERVPWESCQTAVDETKRKIIEQFNVKPASIWTNQRVLIAAMATTMIGLSMFWFLRSPNEPLDLSPDGLELPPSEASGTEPKKTTGPKIDSSSFERDSVILEKSPENVGAILPTESNNTTYPSKIENTSEPNIDDRITHISVGRIIDTKGIALTNVLVTIGGVTDTTDKSGYYTLKVPPGTSNLSLNYSGFNDVTELNTSSDWEIVLDIEKQQIVNRYPMKGANRFK